MKSPLLQPEIVKGTRRLTAAEVAELSANTSAKLPVITADIVPKLNQDVDVKVDFHPDHFAGDKDGYAFTASIKGQPVGHLLIRDEGEQEAQVAWVEVDKEYRHKGVGWLLYTYAIDDLRSKGFKRLTSGSSLTADSHAMWHTYLPKKYNVQPNKGTRAPSWQIKLAVSEQMDMCMKRINTPKTAATKDALHSFMNDVYADTYENPINPRENIWKDVAAIEVRPFGGAIHLEGIRSFDKGQGQGHDALKWLCSLADKHGVEMHLNAVPYQLNGGGLKQKDLRSWYMRNGFEPHSEDSRDSSDMVREPKNGQPKKLKLTDGMMTIPMDEKERDENAPIKLTEFNPKRQHSLKVAAPVSLAEKYMAGALYHGTPTENVEGILRSGLVPPRNASGVYLTEDYQLAANYQEHNSFKGPWSVLKVAPKQLDPSLLAPDDYEFAEVWTEHRTDRHADMGADWSKQPWWVSLDTCSQVRYMGVVPATAISIEASLPAHWSHEASSHAKSLKKTPKLTFTESRVGYLLHINAILNGENIGMVSIDNEEDGQWRVESVAVADAWRGKGIGLVLYTEAAHRAAKAGAVAFTSDFDGDVSPEATRIWERMGDEFDVRRSGDRYYIPLKRKTAARRSKYQTYSPPKVFSDQFNNWFNGSKVVDRAGEPLIVWHGSPDARWLKETGIFQTSREKHMDTMTPEGREDAVKSRAYFFAGDPSTARTYADDSRAWDYQAAEPATNGFYLCLKNPMIINNEGKKWKGTDTSVSQAKAAGHDGVIIKNTIDDYQVDGKKATDVYVAFAPNQIKAAKGNSGDYSTENHSVYASKTSAVETKCWSLRELKEKLRDELSDNPTEEQVDQWGLMDELPITPGGGLMVWRAIRVNKSWLDNPSEYDLGVYWTWDANSAHPYNAGIQPDTVDVTIEGELEAGSTDWEAIWDNILWLHKQGENEVRLESGDEVKVTNVYVSDNYRPLTDNPLVGKTIRASKTAAERAVYYHGTSIKNLRSIMSQGLIPEVKEKMWEEDNNAGVHTPSRVSYGGIYITQNLLTAMGAPRDHVEEGREVVVVVEVQPNTFYMDEDDIVGCLNSPIGHLSDNHYHVGVALIAAKYPTASEGWNEALANYKKAYLEGCMGRFKQKLTEREKEMNPQLEARLTSLVEATWLPALERIAAHHFKASSQYEFSRSWYAVWGSKPESEKVPDKAEVIPAVPAAEAEYRKHVEQITRSLRQAAAPAENGWNNTARITTPIGFKGSNHIVAIAEIRDGRQYRAVNEKGQYTKPSEIIVHYGTLPEDFLNQYRQRIGDKFEVKKTSVLHTKEHADGIMSALTSSGLGAFSVIGSIASRGTSQHDIDILWEPAPSATRVALTDFVATLGFVSYGGSNVSPDEAKDAQKRLKKPFFQGWSHIWHYRNEDTGQKIEFWVEQRDPGTPIPKDAKTADARNWDFYERPNPHGHGFYDDREEYEEEQKNKPDREQTDMEILNDYVNGNPGTMPEKSLIRLANMVKSSSVSGISRILRVDDKAVHAKPGTIVDFKMPLSFTKAVTAVLSGRGPYSAAFTYGKRTLILINNPTRGLEVDYSKLNLSHPGTAEQEVLVAGKYKVVKIVKAVHPGTSPGMSYANGEYRYDAGYTRFVPMVVLEEVAGGKTATTTRMYHSTSPDNRESILEHGLLTSKSYQADPEVGGIGCVYLSTKPDTVPDVWEVDVTGLPLEEDSDDHEDTDDQWWMCFKDIEPSRLKLMTQGKVASPDFGYSEFNAGKEKQLEHVTYDITEEERGVHVLSFTVNAKYDGRNLGGIRCELFRGHNYAVEGIGISEEWRGTGLGQNLYAQAIQHAAKLGAKNFYSDDKQTVDAKSAWARLGKRYKVTQEDGRYRVLLAKTKNAASDFMQWFAGSKVVDDNNKPLKVFHGTDADFDEFQAYSHFGDANAARSRLKMRQQWNGKKKPLPGARTIPCYLKIVNPFLMTDAEANDDAILNNAVRKGKYPELAGDTWPMSDTSKVALERLGYDGIVYDNKAEGGVSYIIFHPEQVRSAIEPESPTV